MLYNVKISDGNRNDVLNYIKSKKLEGNFTVVDVGGSFIGWSAEIMDVLVDFNDSQTQKQIKHFKCDITHPDSWVEILEYVKENGKFDFSICSHTLEDIMNPGFVCEMLSKISKEGFIAIPSKYRELARDGAPYRGYIHHRWIFTIKDSEFIGFPKINYIETNNIFDKIADHNLNRQDLSFFWKEDIKVKYLNNNFLGPDVESVIRYYYDLVDPSYI